MLILWAWSVVTKCCHFLRQRRLERGVGRIKICFWCSELLLKLTFPKALTDIMYCQDTSPWTSCCKLLTEPRHEDWAQCYWATSPYIAKSHLSQRLNSQICIHDWIKGRDSQLSPWSHMDQCLAQSREGHGNLLQYSCLENPMNRGAWRTAVHEVAKSQMQLKQLSR